MEGREKMAAQQLQKQQPAGDGFNFDGMPKAQLYDIMTQMKDLIDQNPQQARQILIDNPLLTRALFQAQIMLGMVQPPKVMPNIQPVSKAQPAQVGQPSNAPSSQAPPTQIGTQGEPSSSQALLSVRQQQPAQPSISVPPASVPPLNFPSQPMPSALSAPQTKSFPPMQVPSLPPTQASQIQNISLPSSAPPHYSTLPPHIPMLPVQPHQALQNPGVFNQVLQPPLPMQPRPVTMQPFSNHFQPHMAHSLGFQPSNAPQQLLQKPLFHSGIPSQNSFVQGQPPLPNQPPQQLFQTGSLVGLDFGNQGGIPMQADRGGLWPPGPPEMGKMGLQVPGPPPMLSGQIAIGTSNQHPRPPPLTPEMEKALLQQVMSLTPEQINLLPPEQRNQVLQLQEMLR